jgi:hypothetical protein
MRLTPENYIEICKQGAFISALIAGFSFAFIGALLVSSIKNKIIDWVMSFSTLSITGLIICALLWTLIASRMVIYYGVDISQVPKSLLDLHKILSYIFIISFLFFLVTLGLSGWIRSIKTGLISSIISIIAIIFFISILKYFLI